MLSENVSLSPKTIVFVEQKRKRSEKEEEDASVATEGSDIGQIAPAQPPSKRRRASSPVDNDDNSELQSTVEAIGDHQSEPSEPDQSVSLHPAFNETTFRKAWTKLRKHGHEKGEKLAENFMKSRYSDEQIIEVEQDAVYPDDVLVDEKAVRASMMPLFNEMESDTLCGFEYRKIINTANIVNYKRHNEVRAYVMANSNAITRNKAYLYDIAARLQAHGRQSRLSNSALVSVNHKVSELQYQRVQNQRRVRGRPRSRQPKASFDVLNAQFEAAFHGQTKDITFLMDAVNKLDVGGSARIVPTMRCYNAIKCLALFKLVETEPPSLPSFGRFLTAPHSVELQKLQGLSKCTLKPHVKGYKCGVYAPYAVLLHVRTTQRSQSGFRMIHGKWFDSEMLKLSEDARVDTFMLVDGERFQKEYDDDIIFP